MNNANAINVINHISAGRVVLLMRRYRLTIAGLARRLNVSQDRVRQVRARGVRGHLNTTSWVEAITGACRFSMDYHERHRAA